MKRIIFASFLFIGILLFDSCQYIQVDTTISPVLEKQTENTSQEFSNETFSFMDESFLEIIESNTGLPNVLYKSAEVQPINYIIKSIHTCSSKNSVLRIAFRNEKQFNGQKNLNQMAMVALGLPDHIKKENIESIRYLRRNYANGIEDLDNLIGFKWKKMEIPNLRIIDGIDEYTTSKVLKITKGIAENDWLIVEIKFNKPYKNTFMPYYFKVADKWYRKYMSTGLGDPA